MKLNRYKSRVGITDSKARQSVPWGVFSSRTMMVMIIAMTPSLNASNRPLPIGIYQVMPATCQFSNAAMQVLLLHRVGCQGDRPLIFLECLIPPLHASENIGARRVIEVIRFQFGGVAKLIDQHQTLFKAFTHCNSYGMIQPYDRRWVTPRQLLVLRRNL